LSPVPSVMDSDQSLAFDEIVKDITSQGNTSQTDYHLITGVAGGGKSFLVKRVAAELTARGFSVHTICVTAMAASIVGGSTFMSFWGLQFDTAHGMAADNAYFRSPNELANRMKEGIRRLGKQHLLIRPTVIIIDEIVSMYDTMVTAMDRALRDIRNCEKPFGNMNILFCGDPLQLTGAKPERYGMYKDLEVKPIWESQLWQQLSVKIYFLSSFHRHQNGTSAKLQHRPGKRGQRRPLWMGNGPDIAYMDFLSEIRNWHATSVLSASSRKVAESIQDSEGSYESEWTVITIYREKARQINEAHLNSLPGVGLAFYAGVLNNDSEDREYGSLSINRKIELKVGARVMCTTNLRGRFFNGDLGVITSFINIGEGATEVHVSTEPHIAFLEPGVKVLLDRTGTEVDIFPIAQDVLDADQTLLYRRRNVPLQLGAAVTCHKVIGATLKYVVIDLSRPLPAKESHQAIERQLNNSWLHGMLYTMLSRVGSSNDIYTKWVGVDRLSRKIIYSPSAVAFNELCQRQSRIPYLRRCAIPSSDIPNMGASQAVTDTTATFRSVPSADPVSSSTMADMMKIMKTDICKEVIDTAITVLINLAQTGLLDRQGHQSTDSELQRMKESQREAFFSMAQDNPSEFRSLMKLDPSSSLRIIRRMKEHAQAGGVSDEEDSVNNQTFLSSEAAVKSPSQIRQRIAKELLGRVRGHQIRERMQDWEHGIEDGEDCESSASLGGSLGGGESDASNSEGTRTAGESENDGEANPRENHEPNTWEENAFYTMRGSVDAVVTSYLEDKPFLQREKSQHERRNSVVLLCRRRTPEKETATATATSRPQPTWRDWPDDTCNMSPILIVQKGPPGSRRCYFYGNKNAGCSSTAWLQHKHDHSTWLCRSCTIPPTLVDLAAAEVSRKPTLTAGDLRSTWEKYREEGKLTQRDVNWLDLKSSDPGYPSLKGNIRNLITSLTKRKEAGLRLDTFLMKIKHLRADDPSRSDISLIVKAILRHDAQDDLPGDLTLRERVNICIATEQPVIEVDPDTGCLARLAILFTSPQMLANYVVAKNLAIDVTFNLLAGKVAMLTLAGLTAEGSSKPVALALVKSENVPDVVASLQQLHDLLDRLALEKPRIERIVQDGSTALNSAIHQFFPPAVAEAVTSCYFHFMQLTKSKKPKDMAVSTWLEFKADLRTIALSHTVHEFCTLLELLRAKWTERQDDDSLEIIDALDAGGWFDTSSFRSRWAACFTGGTSGRTSNSLETYHRILKKVFLEGRTMRTLTQFAVALDDEGFRKASIHNKDRVGGRFVDVDDRRKALKHRGTFALLPRTVPGPSRGECPRAECSGNCTRVSHYLIPDETVYLFIDFDGASDILPKTTAKAQEFVTRDFKVTERVTSQYVNFDSAKKLMKNLHFVSFKTSSQVDMLPQDGGPRCTCLEYARHSKCNHVVLLSRYLGTDETDSWNVLEARIERTAVRVSTGLSNDLPANARYGSRLPAKASRRARQERQRRPSYDELLREFAWPHHEKPTEEQMQSKEKSDTAGCCGGIDDHSLAVYCSSRRCLKSGWWHADCAKSWADATSTEAPDLEDEAVPWYCPRCESSRGKKRKLNARDAPRSKYSDTFPETGVQSQAIKSSDIHVS
ncbi:hypothetical protein FOL47_000258, partial [Perkinsus chesapeaki]